MRRFDILDDAGLLFGILVVRQLQIYVKLGAVFMKFLDLLPPLCLFCFPTVAPACPMSHPFPVSDYNHCCANRKRTLACDGTDLRERDPLECCDGGSMPCPVTGERCKTHPDSLRGKWICHGLFGRFEQSKYKYKKPLILISLLIVFSIVKVCPPLYQYVGSSCYKLSTTNKDFEDAMQVWVSVLKQHKSLSIGTMYMYSM